MPMYVGKMPNLNIINVNTALATLNFECICYQCKKTYFISHNLQYNTLKYIHKYIYA